jgi:hypothetical protein
MSNCKVVNTFPFSSHDTVFAIRYSKIARKIKEDSW